MASIPLDVKTPLSTFIIDEEKTTLFDNVPTKPKSKFRQRPRHSSQDFTEWQKKRDDEEKENQFDSQINSILNAFAKQYMREYIKMKIKTSVYDTIDSELNRKSFASFPQYYHLRKKNIKSPRSSSKRFLQQKNKLQLINQSNAVSSPVTDYRLNEGFQPVYSLRIASSRTEIGADKNEYTAYIIVGSRISPFDSKITVSVKRFVELRTFSSEIRRKLLKNNKNLSLSNEFPSLTRLFGNIDKNKLESRRSLINLYLQSLCEDENAVRHSYFLSFFDFNDGQYNYIDNNEKNKQINKYKEEEFRLKCIEETLEIIGMPGGIGHSDDDYDSDSSTPAVSGDDHDNDHDTTDDDDDIDDFNENYFISSNFDNDLIDNDDLHFEVPYDLHHYKNPEYKLIAAIFDIIQQQIEVEEANLNNDNDGNATPTPKHVQTNSTFLNSFNAANPNVNVNINGNHSPTGPGVDDLKISDLNGFNQVQIINFSANQSHHNKTHGGKIAPAPIKHLRTTSIIETSFTPATPMEFHPSISTLSGKIFSNINSNNVISSTGMHSGWTSSTFKNKFHSSIRGLDGGPRIIRTASEATSDRSLSYKIPTMVSEVWQKITDLLNKKLKCIPILLNNISNDLYPIIQEAMNDVAPIIKILYNNSPNDFNIDNDHVDDNKDNKNKLNLKNLTKLDNNSNSNNDINQTHAHGKYVSLFGGGYDGDDDSSSDSDCSNIKRDIGIRHFPYIKAMKEYCLTESRLYEFFLAFENLAIDKVFGDINVVFADIKKPKQKQKQNQNQKGGGASLMKNKKNVKHNKGTSVDFGDYLNQIMMSSTINSNGNGNTSVPSYTYINLLHYNYSVLENTSSTEFTERIQHIVRIHSQINLILCEIIYATLKCMMKCLGDIILYKDQLEEKYINCGSTFDQDVINNHEDSLLNILRDSGYNISFIVDDLKQKIKSEFKEYSSVIFNPLLDGISTIGELSLNCICLIISQFVFDDGQFPANIKLFRKSFIEIWFSPINHYISDITECIFHILYQSSIGLVHSASQDLLQNNIFNIASSATSYSTSLWYQILRGKHNNKRNNMSYLYNKKININKYIPRGIKKNINVKDILDLVIERTLTNIVDETLIYIKLECEKSFFKKFEKKEQRLFNDFLN